jgi:hypothetical protein
MSLATAILTGSAEALIPGRIPARVLSTAWRYAKPVGGIFKFGEAVLVGFKSPISTYETLKVFTAGKAGAVQAHHILEARHLRAWGLSVDAAPAQILAQARYCQVLWIVAIG